MGRGVKGVVVRFLNKKQIIQTLFNYILNESLILFKNRIYSVFICILNKINTFCSIFCVLLQSPISFVTDVLEELKEKGSISKMAPELVQSCKSRELQCNQCSYKPKTMPQLKEHLLTHLKKEEN